MIEAGTDLGEIRQAVARYLSARTALDLSRLKGDERLLQRALIDSLQLIELIIWIEDQTDEPVETERLLVQDDLTIDAIARYIHGARGPSAAAA